MCAEWKNKRFVAWLCDNFSPFHFKPIWIKNHLITVSKTHNVKHKFPKMPKIYEPINLKANWNFLSCIIGSIKLTILLLN